MEPENIIQQAPDASQKVLPNTTPLVHTNSKKNTIRISIIIFGIIGILGVAGILLLSQKKQVPSQVTQSAIHSPTIMISPTPADSLSANWKTYQNTEYGFVVKYPSGVEVFESPAQSHTFMGQCGELSLIACLDYPIDLYNHPNFAGASVSINAIRNDEYTQKAIKTESDCKQYLLARSSNQDSVSTKVINGTVFYYGTFGQGATGHEISKQYNAVYHNNICFDVIVSVEYNAPLDNSKEFTTNDETNVFAQLNQMLSTFKFTN